MALDILNPILAMGQPQGGQQINPLATLVPLLIMMGLFIYLTSRSQKKKAAEHAQMISKLKTGDRVVTNSGIIGTVVNVKEKSVTIRTAGDTKLEFTKPSIAEVTTSSDSSES